MLPSNMLVLNQLQNIPVFFALLSPGEFFAITYKHGVEINKHGLIE